MNQNRVFFDRIRTRILEKDPLIQVVLGPRQVGKSTAVKALAEEFSGQYFTADSPSPLPAQIIEAWWQQAVEKSEASQLSQPLLVIDEIQKIPGWSDVLKKLWDQKRTPVRVVVSGSATLQIEKGLRESLAGRFELIRAEHWNFAEARRVFGLTLDQYIEFGCFPGAQRLRSSTDRWAEYIRDSIVEPVIGRDLMQLHPVQNPSLLRQLLGVALELPAQVVSLQKLQGQLQDRGAIATIQHYLWLLGQAFLVSGIQKYSPEPFQTRQSSPKLIVHENSFIRAHERPVVESVARERLGRYLENSIGSRLIEAGWKVHYWKDRSEEVDFMAMGPNGENWAIEVKWSMPERSELKALFACVKKFPKFEPILVLMDPASHSIEGVKVVSAEQVLSLCG